MKSEIVGVIATIKTCHEHGVVSVTFARGRVYSMRLSVDAANVTACGKRHAIPLVRVPLNM